MSAAPAITRRCPMCRLAPPEVAYGADSSRPDGHAAYCLRCKSARGAADYRRHVERRRAARAAYRATPAGKLTSERAWVRWRLGRTADPAAAARLKAQLRQLNSELARL